MSEPLENGGGMRGAEDVVRDIVRRPVFLHDVVTESYLGGFTYERLQMGDFVLGLLHETSEFRSRAASYRGFDVAAGAWCKGEGNTYGRVLGHNVKLDGTDYVNIHAEDMVTTKAEDANLGRIAVLAVIGPIQEDHASGLEMDTLHPCGRCRDRLAASPLIDEKTLFVTARPDFTVIQLASLSAIRAAHNGGGSEEIRTFTFPETPRILQPRDMPNEWRPNVAPVEVEEVDCTDYDSTIGLYLSHRYFESQQKA